MLVLGIETSCDETGVALYDSEKGLLAHALYSQIKMHTEYGGVVPELASRDHVRKLLPLIKEVMEKAECSVKDIAGIAYTAGPGLIGALLVGATLASSLAWAWQIPCVAIHHMEGHLLAALLEKPTLECPFVALLVSGGHTMLIDVQQLGKYRVLGESLDDAAGEAFDKTAKLLGLPYPGGSILAALAEQGEPGHFHFPRPMLNRPNLDFSFSGLKTAVLNAVNKQAELNQQIKANIAYEFQAAVVDTLVTKSMRALQQTGNKRLVVAGGVGANKLLRHSLEQQISEINGEVFFPRLEFCTDNGAMIAYAGYLRLLAGQNDGMNIQVYPRWSLESLVPIMS